MDLIEKSLKRLGYSKTPKEPSTTIDAKQKSSIQELFSSGGAYNSQYISKLGSQKEQMQAFRDWVFAAVGIISEAVAAVEFEAYVNRTSTKSTIVAQRINQTSRMKRKLLDRKIVTTQKGVTKSSGALEELENHILLDVLYAPNKFMTKDEFFELTMQHMLLAGEAFWTTIRNGQGTIIELWPLMPYAVEHIPSKTDFISGYIYHTPSGGRLPLPPEDVIHHKFMNPNSLYRGMSFVQAAARSIDTDTHAADWNRNFFYLSLIHI